MNSYTVRQLNKQGDVVSEKHVEAGNTDDALRQLNDISDATQRIEVFDRNHEKVRQIGAAYSRQKRRRTGW